MADIMCMERFDFYSDVVFVLIAYLGMGQRICCGSGDRHLGPIGPTWRSPEPQPFARYRSPSDDQPDPGTGLSRRRPRLGTRGAGSFAGGVANCAQPTGEQRPLRFFCLKKLHEVNHVGTKGYSQLG